jgi:spore germination cell wall hydrolase CwlJ-like protein
VIAEAVLCAALNVYHEARSEPWESKMAVALVTRNRARLNKTSVCWEVFRYKQFSWTLEPKKLQALPTGPAWQDAIQIARTALNTSNDFTHGATEYHLTKEPAWWSPYMLPVGVWGSHTFYRKAT